MRIALGILFALALGLGSADAAVTRGRAAGDVRVGPWRTNLTTGSLLLRRVVPSEGSFAEIDAVRKRATVRPR